MPDRAPSSPKSRLPLAGVAATVVAVALLATACGGGSGTAGAPDPGAVTGGWLGGEPLWRLESEAGLEGGATLDAGAATTSPVETRADAFTASEADDVATAAPESTTVPVPGPPAQPGMPLRAGSVDDNEDFTGYLDYLRRLTGAGIVTRGLDPDGRVVVTVTGAGGLPVRGAEVVVSRAGTEVARLRTTADGTARFLPALHGAPSDGTFEVTVGAATSTVAAGEAVTVPVDRPGGAAAPVPLDVVFLLDATGSMGDEIDRLKATMDSVAERLSTLPASPDLRLGMTLYRDQGDSFVTSTFDFTADVAAFRSALAAVVADGGGDYPEALDEGLAEVLAAPSWRDPASTVQLVFLVADAPPQVDRQVEVPYPAAVVDAIGRGIKVFPVASSGTDDQAEAVFRQIAQATGGRLVFLSYGAGGAALGGGTDIGTTDYEELALDDLVVRLVAEELAALTGSDPAVPTTTTSTTNPPGQ